jgi:hypothetical protein
MEVVVLAMIPENGDVDAVSSEGGEGRDSTFDDVDGAGWKGVNWME